MALYLVQHGKALPRDQDPEQGLSEEGIKEVEGIAEVAACYKVRVSSIRHSGKKRARQTAEIFASALDPDDGFRACDGLNPMDDVEAVAVDLTAGQDLMLVGHLPFMERLAGLLVTGSAETRVFKFQNGGILCLDEDPESRSWVIKWSLMPMIG